MDFPLFIESFANGNGNTFLPGGYYERTPLGANTPDDANYPLIEIQEGLQVITGGGPSGQNYVDTLGTGGYTNFASTGILFTGIGDQHLRPRPTTVTPYWVGGYVNGQQGYMKASFRLTSGSASNLFFSPVFACTHDSTSEVPLILWADFYDTNDYRLGVDFWNWTGSFPTVPFRDYHETYAAFDPTEWIGTWKTIEMRWKAGTKLVASPSVSSDVAEDGFITVSVDDSPVIDIQNVAPYFRRNRPSESAEYLADEDNFYYFNSMWLGLYDVIGQSTDLEVGVWADEVVPPLQRASYVFFSNDIAEQQVETRLTRSFLQILVADPPPAVAPSILELVQIVGNVRNAQGVIVTSGALIIQPRSFINVGDYLVTPNEVSYTITGAVDFNLAPSNGVLYEVEFDPTPSDTSIARNLKSGYWKRLWNVPSTGPVDIATL